MSHTEVSIVVIARCRHKFFYNRNRYMASCNKLLRLTSKLDVSECFKVKIMTKKLSSTTGILIGGIAFFTLGLLVILRLNPVFGLFSQIIPDAQAIEVVGVVVQFLGQALVVFGATKSSSHKLVSSMQIERQNTIAGFAQNIQQLQNRLQTEQQALKTGYTQTMAKLDTLIANQRTGVIPPKVLMPSNCKFCGTRIEHGHFCSQCGKAN
jgi:hypothetical protein